MDDLRKATYSTGEVGRMTGLSHATVLRALKSGRLQYAFRTPGGHYRIPKWAIQELISSLENDRDRPALVSVARSGDRTGTV